MKRIILLSLIISINISLYAQNWSIFNSGEAYHYKRNISEFASDEFDIIYTLHADSLKIINEDTIFYMPVTLFKCDTCAPYLKADYAYTERYMYDLFKKYIIKKPNGDCFFISGSDSVVIKSKCSQGDSWISNFDGNSHNISCTEIYPETILGEQDSVKKFIIEDANVEILLSKDHGLVQFPHSLTSNDTIYSLAGIQSRESGIQVPDFWNIYDFEIGDIFQYYYSYLDASSFGAYDNTSKSKYIIYEKGLNQDSLLYKFNGGSYHCNEYHTPWEDGCNSRTFSGTWNFTYDPKHPMNKYTGYIWKYDNSGYYKKYTWDEDLFLKTRVIIDKDRVYKKVGCDFELYEYILNEGIDDYGIYFSTDHEKIFRAVTDEYELLYSLEYQPGLGLTHDYWSMFEHAEGEYLTATRTSTISFGDLMVDIQEKLIDPSSVSINYPHNNLQLMINFREKYVDIVYQLVSIDGKILKQESLQGNSTYQINVSYLKSGIYYLRVFSNEFNASKSFYIP